MLARSFDFEAILEFAHAHECRIPSGLKLLCNQAILRINGFVAFARMVRDVPRLL